MRVLWFVNIPFPAVWQRLGRGVSGGGFWMTALAEALAKRTDLELTVVTASDQVAAPLDFTADAVRYVTLPPRGVGNTIIRLASRTPGCRRVRGAFKAYWPPSQEPDVADLLTVVNTLKPDLVHIHGTERCFGLVSEHLSIPTVVGLQGLCNAYLPHYRYGLSWSTRVRLFDEWRWHLDLWWGARRERRIFSANSAYIGRTAWDRAQQAALQPDGTYYLCYDVERPAFYRRRWNLANAHRHAVYTTSNTGARKGAHLLVEAAALLQRTFPRLTVRLGGVPADSEWGRFLKRLAARRSVAGKIEFLGYLTEEQMSEELERAHAFAFPSFIDNSPNAVCEAQLVGTPVVASYTGGVPSLVKEGETGLLFPVGDASVLAMRLGEVLGDDALAWRLSENARRVAHERHDPNQIVARTVEIYQDLLARKPRAGLHA